MSSVLALDLGGTHLRAGLAEQGRIAEAKLIGRWPAPRDFAAFQDRISEILDATGPIARVGVAAPGLVHASLCSWIPNLPWLNGQDLVDLVPGARLALGNDCQFSLLAEATLGAAAELRDAILLSIGTGVGSAVLADGRIVRGGQGGACSFGWACADIRDPGHHNNGWLERMAAGRVLDMLAERELGVADGSRLIASARAGNERALQALGAPAVAIGTTLAGAVALLDPQAVLITGGVAESFDVLAPSLTAAMRRQLPAHLKSVEVRVGRFGGRAALIGAAIAGLAADDWRRVR